MYTWTSNADSDLWGHVRFGQDLLRSHRVDRPDEYSYLTGGARWINHEWLAEAVFAWAHDRGGATALNAVKVIGGLTGAWIAFVHLRRRGLQPLQAALWIVVCETLVLPGAGSLRPQMFTCLALVILLALLDRAEGGHPRVLWWLVPLFVAWINLHGGVIAGVGLVGIWVVTRICAPTGLRNGSGCAAWLPIVLPVSAAIAATAINPYGPSMWWFLRTAVGSRPEIAEWNPVSLLSLPGVLYGALASVWIGGLAVTRYEVPAGQRAVSIVLTLLPLVALRHLSLFAIGAMVLGGEHVAALVSRLWAQKSSHPGTAPSRMALMMCVAAGTSFVGVSLPRVPCIIVDDTYPARQVALLVKARVRGNLVVHFDWGEYVLWYAGPAIKVSVDGRRETIYDDASYLPNMRFEDGIGDWDALLRDDSVSMALVSKQFPTYNLMRLTPGWTLVDEGVQGALFARNGSDALQRLLAVPKAGLLLDRCFP